MNKSIIFWGINNESKITSADICSLLFNQDKIIRTTASELNPSVLSFNEKVKTELVIVTDCFEEEQIHELDYQIRKHFVSGAIRIIYMFFSEKPPIFLNENRFHIMECVSSEKEPIQLSETFEKVLPENLHLLQSVQFVEL